jgi:nucleoid DNA-binding protein
MPTYYEQPILAEVSAITGRKAYIINEILDAYFENLRRHIEKGDLVYVPRFGKFTRRRRAARTIHDPISGNPRVIAERWNVHYIPSPYLNNRLNPPDPLKKGQIPPAAPLS